MIFNISQFLIGNAFPAKYLWAVFAGLIVFGALMMFKGRFMWAISTAVAGAGLGYYIATMYVIPFMSAPHTYNLWIFGKTTFTMSNTFPNYLWILVLAVIVSILASIAVRLVLSGSVAYGIFYLLIKYPIHSTYFASGIYGVPYMDMAIFIVALAIAYFLYSKISILVAGMVGVLVMYMGLTHFMAPIYAIIPLLILFPLGMYLQYTRYHSFHDIEEQLHNRQKRDREIRRLRAKLEKVNKQTAAPSRAIVGRREHGPQQPQ